MDEVARSFLEFHKPSPRGGMEAIGSPSGGEGLMGFWWPSLSEANRNGSAVVREVRTVRSIIVFIFGSYRHRTSFEL